MNKVFLFLFSPVFGTTESLRSMVRDLPGVLGWRYDMPNAFYLLCNGTETAQSLYDKIKPSAPPNALFLVTELDSTNLVTTMGWLTTESVHLIDKRELHPNTPGLK